MAKIVAKTLSETLGDLATIAAFNGERFRGRSADDLFLCALGFEPRCLTIPRRLRALRYTAHRAICFTYHTNVEDNDANLPALQAELRGLAPKVQFMDCDSEDFPGQFRDVLELLLVEGTRDLPRVTLDISVTANRLLLRCIAILLEYDCDLRIVYSEANIYHPTREEFEREPDRWRSDNGLGLERGVDKIIYSVDHPGHALDPLPDCVILFPSFKQERTRAVISAVDPSLLTNPANKVIWLLGKPHLG